MNIEVHIGVGIMEEMNYQGNVPWESGGNPPSTFLLEILILINFHEESISTELLRGLRLYLPSPVGGGYST